jgi:hypothetical protein
MEMQTCPFCSEEIKKEAKKCKHCGETIDVALRAAEEAKRSSQSGANGPIINVSNSNSASSSAAAAASASGGSLWSRITCLDWILIFCTGGLWLIVVALRR